MLRKFQYFMPIPRLVAEWRELGVEISPGTWCGIFERLGPLFQPLIGRPAGSLSGGPALADGRDALGGVCANEGQGVLPVVVMGRGQPQGQVLHLVPLKGKGSAQGVFWL